MLSELGFKYCAYDWRPGDEASFEAEIKTYEKHGIEMFAFWKGHELAFELFRKHQIAPQLWHTLREGVGETHEEKVSAAVITMEPLAIQAALYEGKLGLYNHGGWGEEPENMIAVCEGLKAKGHENVGIVYNFHHGHEQIDQWGAVFPKLKPYLLCLNLNGMTSGEVTSESKIMLLSKGEVEGGMLCVVLESGYEGPIGILDHDKETDTRETLIKNLKGLDELLAQLQSDSR